MKKRISKFSTKWIIRGYNIPHQTSKGTFIYSRINRKNTLLLTALKRQNKHNVEAYEVCVHSMHNKI